MRTLRLGDGTASLDHQGSPVAFGHPRLPGLDFLLSPGTDRWHTTDRVWGAGLVITGRSAAQWAAPDRVDTAGAVVAQRYDTLTEGLVLTVQRSGGDRLRESYRWTNTGDHPVEIGSLAISTPWRDVYAAGGAAHDSGVHAHLSTTGAQSWVLVKPMRGHPPYLGLLVTRGVIGTYSVESRNQLTGSNVRGHLLLQVTDAARHPGAAGGQRTVRLQPGGTYRLDWELGWFDTEAAFVAEAEPTVRVPVLAALVGEPLLIEHPAGRHVTPLPPTPLTGADHADSTGAPGPTVTPTADGSTVTSARHGVVELDVGPNAHDPAVRVGVLFHRPLADLVRARVAVILDRHRPLHRPAPRGFVACDTSTGLTSCDQGWPDWSDAAERIAMPVLLAEARLRGLVDPARTAAVDAAIDEFAAFVADRLVDPDGWVRRGSGTCQADAGPRLYNTPWAVDFLVLHHRLTGRVASLELALTLLEASVRHGVDRHLSIGHPQAIFAVEVAAAALTSDASHGLRSRAGDLLAGLRRQALDLAARGADLPAHEVAYEQSIVAPLLSLLALAQRRWPDERLLAAARQALDWLLAFAGPQRHVRLRHIAIRHWDGYWFGRNRRWGDVFPHYWSTLTAVALTELPDELRTAGHDAVAAAILRANLALYDGNARGCCAFGYPSCVDGVPTYGADPLDNDQDWALVFALRSGLVP